MDHGKVHDANVALSHEADRLLTVMAHSLGYLQKHISSVSSLCSTATQWHAWKQINMEEQLHTNNLGHVVVIFI